MRQLRWADDAPDPIDPIPIISVTGLVYSIDQQVLRK